jgi:hypothetical protein
MTTTSRRLSKRVRAENGTIIEGDVETMETAIIRSHSPQMSDRIYVQEVNDYLPIVSMKTYDLDEIDKKKRMKREETRIMQHYQRA